MRTDLATLLHGAAGHIEAVISTPDNVDIAAAAIVCHPHPLHGGTMDNKVVTTLARTYCDLGAATLRFNFRGVGLSAGSYAQGAGETEDLLLLIEHMQTRYPGLPLHLAGFSFGAYVALRAVQRYTPAELITVSPPVHLYDFSEIQAPACPWLLIQGKADEVVPYPDVLKWVSKVYPAPDTVFLDDVGHYFHGQLGTLRQIVQDRYNRI